MPPVFWLDDDDAELFPNPNWSEPSGILAIGGDLSLERLLHAYQHGIFPWYNPGDPILWWCPDPRFVLFPQELVVHKSLRSYFNQRKFKVSYDKCFREVISACRSTERKGQEGPSWITDEMLEAYCTMHEKGYAHSVEVWMGEELVGGLYGLAIGKVFFGESMFARVSNASKVGFVTLVKALQSRGYWLIDCQQETAHLGSLGARGIPRDEFLQWMDRNRKEPVLLQDWGKWNK